MSPKVENFENLDNGPRMQQESAPGPQAVPGQYEWAGAHGDWRHG